MFSLLVFFFKLFFSTFFSILFSYFIIEEEENNLGVMLFGVLGASLSLFYLTVSKEGDSSSSIAILLFSILYLSYYFFDISNDSKKLLFIFPGIIGLMVGFGLILESVLLFGFLYISKNGLSFVFESDDLIDDKMPKKEENNK